MKVGDKFRTYFGGPYEIVAIHPGVKVMKINKNPIRTVVEYRTQSGFTGKILACLVVPIGV